MSSTQEPYFVRHRHEREQKAEEREGAGHYAAERQQNYSMLAALIEDICTERREQNESERKRRPIEWIAAGAAIIAAIASVGSLIAFGILTNKALEVSKTQLTQERPWVSALSAEISPDDAPPPDPSNYDQAELTLTLKNTGNSVARRGATVAIPVLGQNTIADPTLGTRIFETVWNTECREAETTLTNVGNQKYLTGFVIAPGQTIQDRQDINNQQMINNKRFGASARIDIGDFRDRRFWLYGCASYVDQFGKRHHTKFCFLKNPFAKEGDTAFVDCAQAEEAD